MLIDAERSATDLDSIIADGDEPAVAAITIAELGVGIEIATGKRRQARRAFLDDLVSSVHHRRNGQGNRPYGRHDRSERLH